MYWLIMIIAANALITVGLGGYLRHRPPANERVARRWWRGTLFANVLLFLGLAAAMLMLGLHTAFAQATAPTPTAAAHGQVSVGLGLALLGAGLPTALAAFGAGIAVGPVGAAALAVIAEKPEMFGRSLIYLGLAEGIAIYGLIVSILLIGKIA